MASGFILEAPLSSKVLTACSVVLIPPIPVPRTIPTFGPKRFLVSKPASFNAFSVAYIERCDTKDIPNGIVFRHFVTFVAFVTPTQKTILLAKLCEVLNRFPLSKLAIFIPPLPLGSSYCLILCLTNTNPLQI